MSESLPEQTSDDTDQGWGETPASGDDDDRLRDEVPPHHVDRD